MNHKLLKLVMSISLLTYLLAANTLSAGAQQTSARLELAPDSPLAPGDTLCVSLATTEANDSSTNPSISSDGRYVAFQSDASNLVSDDTNGWADVFVHDTQTGATRRVSLASNGTPGNHHSGEPALSADGRYVAFGSFASNLVSGDTNGNYDVFVHDIQTGATRRVSVASDGTQGNDYSGDPAISSDGRYVAFVSEASNLVSGDTNGASDIFVHDIQTGATSRVSLASDGAQGSGHSYDAAISANGTYIAFESLASNLVSGDSNGKSDVFVHDTQTGATSRVSLASDGAQGNDHSYDPSLSADGRYVAFWSWASTLVSGDSGWPDVFVHDTQTGATSRVSVTPDGAQANNFSYGPAISADGGYVAFESAASNLVRDTNGKVDVFVHGAQDGATQRVSTATDGTQGDDYSGVSALSADGRYVAFQSKATNLVSGDTNGVSDIFVHDTQTGATRRVSVASDGAEGNSNSTRPALSADGRYVAFQSLASNLVSGDTNEKWDIFVHDAQTGFTTRVSVASDGAEGNSNSTRPALSADGRYVAFQSAASNLVSGDTNEKWDIFLHDTQTGTTRRVSIASDGAEGNDISYEPAISADGRYVAFQSFADNLVSVDTNGTPDIFVHDTQTGATRRVSLASDGAQGNDSSYNPSLSADGRYVAFRSAASNLVSGDTNEKWDIFLHDTQTGTTRRVSLASDGTEGNHSSSSPALSADGRFVAFASHADNLVSGDTNGEQDVFVHDTQTGATRRVSLASDGAQGNDYSINPAISADGRYVAFASVSSNLVSGDTNGYYDIFMHDTQAGSTRRVSIASDGAQGNLESDNPAISADGRYVAFVSASDNLVSGDTNGVWDIFVHENDLAAPAVVSITRADPNPTSAPSVAFSVTFSEIVTGVDGGDFALTTSGSVSGAAVTGVSGGGDTYAIIVSTGAGRGTLRLDVPASATITDLAGNPLTGLPYTSGQAYTLLTEVYIPVVARSAP